MRGLRTGALKSSTRTSKQRYYLSKIAAATAVVACGVVYATAAVGQVSLFKDEEARQRIDELDAQLELLIGNMRQMATEAARLNTEKQELLELVRELSGLVDEANRTSANHNTRLSDLAAKVDAETQSLDKQINAQFNQLAANISSDDTELYNQAISTYYEQKLDTAASLLHKLLRQSPTSAYGDAARYWLGRMQFEQGNTLAAQETLTELVTLHPDSERAPDALLLLEVIATQRDAPIAAAHWRLILLERYPASAAADRRRREQVLE